MIRICQQYIFIVTLIISQGALSSDTPTIPEVYQREYIHTNANDQSFVQTAGLVTCIALTIYDAHSRTGVLAHIDGKTTDNDIKMLFSHFQDISKLNVQLHGGLALSKFNLMPRVINLVSSLGILINYKSQNLTNTDSMSILLNLETGAVSKYTEIYRFYSYAIYSAKSNRMKYSKKLFRHSLSIGGGDELDIRESHTDSDLLYLNY
jgi:hypothetical protein